MQARYNHLENTDDKMAIYSFVLLTGITANLCCEKENKKL